MDLENKPLKTSVELAMEKTEKKEERVEKPSPLKTSVQIAMEKVELMEESAKSEESDAKAIEELNKKYNMPPSPAIAEKMAEADEIKAKEAELLSSVEGNGQKKTLAEKNDEAMKAVFGENEGTAGRHLDNTTAEGRQEFIDLQESDEEKTAKEINSQPETLEERNQKIINETESDYEAAVREIDAQPETLEEKNQKIINATESDYEKTAREADLAKEIAGAQNYEELYAAFQKGGEFTSSFDNKKKFSGQDMIDRVEDLRNVMAKNMGSMRKNFDDPSFLSYANEYGMKDKIIELLKKDIENAGAEEEAALAAELELSDKMKSEQEPVAPVAEKPVAEKENKSKWEGDVTMQAMEDFINSQKEKNATTEALSEMIAFIRKKGAEISKGKSAVSDVISDFAKKSGGWFGKMFKGAEIGKSKEASKIDRIMSGDNRSDEAIKIDGAMGKAFENKDGKIEAMERKLGLASTPGELIGSLDGIDGLEGSQGMYRTEDQKKYIQYLFNSGNENYLRFITRTGGLRENVQRVFNEKKSRQENLQQAA